MDFTAIDFETAQGLFPCEVGVTRVECGKIAFSHSWLIKPACFPYMNPFNEQIHGISSSDLVSSNTFEELWSELKPLLEDQVVVAHNAPFDMAVLRTVLAYYDLAVPWIDYFCSVTLSRKAWKSLPSHSLKCMCDYHKIQFNHHRAGDDACACALVVLKAFEMINCNSLEDGLEYYGMKLKRLKL